MKKLLFALLSMFLIGSIQGVSGEEESSGDTKKLYLAHNLWYENPKSVSTIGYKRGTMIPAGTEVTNVVAGKSAVSFSVDEWDLHIRVVIDNHQKDSLTAVELRDRMFSHQNIEEMQKNLTDLEELCVKRGYVAPGIRKMAVIMAYGYPPKHRTPSTDMPTWIYWTSRFVNRTLNFDDEGKTLNGIGN